MIYGILTTFSYFLYSWCSHIFSLTTTAPSKVSWFTDFPVNTPFICKPTNLNQYPPTILQITFTTSKLAQPIFPCCNQPRARDQTTWDGPYTWEPTKIIQTNPKPVYFVSPILSHQNYNRVLCTCFPVTSLPPTWPWCFLRWHHMAWHAPPLENYKKIAFQWQSFPDLMAPHIWIIIK